MKITTSNYAENISKFNVSEFPPAIKSTFDVVNKYTSNGTDWSAYKENENVKRVVDKFFNLVEPFIQKEAPKTPEKKKPELKKETKKAAADKNYIVYFKNGHDVVFSAMDIAAGIKVANLIHATIVPEENLEKLKKSLIESIESGGAGRNPHFQIRVAGESTVVWDSEKENIQAPQGQWYAGDRTLYSDNSHGWLAVKIKELEELGIADKITHYSYMKGDMAYLEEDQDLNTYILAIRKKYPNLKTASDFNFNRVEQGNSSPIRNYASYEYKKKSTPAKKIKLFAYEGKTYNEKEIIDLANTTLHYELKDQGEDDFTDGESAHKALIEHSKAPKSKKSKAKAKAPKKEKSEGTPVEKVSESVYWIKRFLNMNGKVKTENQVLNLLNGLQKAILERRIRKDDQHAKHIDHIQDQIIKCYNRMKGEALIEIHPDTVKQLEKIANSETNMLSIALLKRYVGIQAAKGTKEKAAKLTLDIMNAMAKEKVKPNDKYATELENAVQNLKKYTEGTTKQLVITEPQLNGLAALGIITGKAVKGARKMVDGKFTVSKKRGKDKFKGHGSYHGGLTGEKKKEEETLGTIGNPIIIALASGYMARKGAQIAEKEAKEEEKKELVSTPAPAEKKPADPPKPKAIKKNGKGLSLGEISEQTFEPLGLEGKYRDLIGDACKPTHLFIYGAGGAGKSSCAYLISKHLNEKTGARIGYFAGEQFNSPTFRDMIKRLGTTTNENFLVFKSLSDASLDDFDIVIFDSKDAMGIGIDTFRQIKKNHPQLTTITTSQGKKDGNFRGSEEWRNEVDTMIKCEIGWAKTDGDKNRWGGRLLMKIEPEK